MMPPPEGGGITATSPLGNQHHTDRVGDLGTAGGGARHNHDGVTGLSNTSGNNFLDRYLTQVVDVVGRRDNNTVDTP